MPELEDDLVLPHAHRDLVVGLQLRDAHELLQRSRGDVRLEASLQRLLQLRLLDAQPVRVRCDHAQLLSRGRHQDPGEHGPGLIA